MCWTRTRTFQLMTAQQKTELQDGHQHDLTIKPWMPLVNDTVLTLYLPVFNGDGFVLGGIG